MTRRSPTCARIVEGGWGGGEDCRQGHGRERKETGKRVRPLLRRGCEAAWEALPGVRELGGGQAGGELEASSGRGEEGRGRKGEKEPKGGTRSVEGRREVSEGGRRGREREAHRRETWSTRWTPARQEQQQTSTRAARAMETAKTPAPPSPPPRLASSAPTRDPNNGQPCTRGYVMVHVICLGWAYIIRHV